MLILLRKTRHRGNRVADQRDAELHGKHLTVGSGGDQRLQLFGDGVGAAHARVTPQSGGRLLIECTRGHSVSVDGQQARCGRIDVAGIKTEALQRVVLSAW